MAVINETVTIEGNEITVSLLAWRRFHLPTPGLHEAILNANRDLADAGVYIPLGRTVAIPIDTDRPYDRPEEIRLWDEL